MEALNRYLLFFAFSVIYPLHALASGIPFEIDDGFVAGFLIYFGTAVFYSLSYKTYLAKGGPIIYPYHRAAIVQFPTLPLLAVLSFLTSGLSVVMLERQVGITIYPIDANLPYRLAGIMVYTRLLIIPLLFYFLFFRDWGRYSFSKVILAYICLGTAVLVVSFTSGSRLLPIIYGLTCLAYSGRSNAYSICASLALIATGMYVATYSRFYFLPEFLAVDELIRVYVADTFSEMNIFHFVLEYYRQRTLGFNSLLSSLAELGITWRSLSVDHFFRAPLYIIGLDSLFFQNIDPKSIRGDHSWGGVGLDFISHYWLSLGGNIYSYLFGLFCIARMHGFIVGFIQSLFFGFERSIYGPIPILCGVFLIIMDGRLTVIAGVFFICLALHAARYFIIRFRTNVSDPY